jgi:hypothetical protein
MIKKIGLVIFASVAIPFFVFAAANGSVRVNTNVWDPAILKGPLIVCTGNYASNQNLPQCSDLCDFVSEAIQILYYMIGVAIWVILPIYFAIAGISFMVARGDPGAISKARARITEAFWGLGIMLCAWIIVATFVNFFNLGSYVAGFGTNGACIVTSGGVSCGGTTYGSCSNGQVCVAATDGSGTYSCGSGSGQNNCGVCPSGKSCTQQGTDAFGNASWVCQ